jgi:hypothetical protein
MINARIKAVAGHLSYADSDQMASASENGVGASEADGEGTAEAAEMTRIQNILRRLERANFLKSDHNNAHPLGPSFVITADGRDAHRLLSLLLEDEIVEDQVGCRALM